MNNQDQKTVTLITEYKNYALAALVIYRKLGTVHLMANMTETEADQIKKTTNVLVVALKYQINKEWVDAMPNLKIIATQTTGLNHIDVEYLKQKNIALVSLRGQTDFLKNITSTAEEAMALLLALVRNIPWSFDDVKKGNWRRDDWFGHQILGKKFGILGLGRLGKIMAGYAKAFGMEVLACDPNVSSEVMNQLGVKSVSMEQLFQASDAISIHVLLTPETQNLVTEKHLRMMRPTAYVVNNARAELIEKDALYNALANKWIAGAATDVLWDERSDGSHLKSDRLVEYAKNNNNLIIVPHIGGATFEAMDITQEFLAGLVAKSL